jgi:probable F420-dependent oxidoreductase
MHVGVVFPQTEFGCDPAAIRDYVQTAEGLGFSHVLAYDHVLGANPQRPGGLNGPYTHESAFLEPLTFFSFVAAATQKLGLVTGILILPQRQTALVAKQAATLDVLSKGRLRLGVGLGWNDVEYEALGQDFHTRGRRIEEQVVLLRRLWTEPLVTFNGEWHAVTDAGLNPLPVQRPIPIWFGAQVDAALRRAARLGDGWMPNYRTPAEALPSIEALARYLAEAGRSREGFGLEARVPYGPGDPAALQALVEGWCQAGATHLSVNTMGSGLQTPSGHITAIRAFAKLVGLA